MNKHLILSLALITFLLSGLLVIPSEVRADEPLTTSDMSTGLTADQLVAKLVNTNSGLISYSGVTYTGANDAAGTFSATDGNIIGFSDGIVLSTGNIANIKGPNTSTRVTTVNGTPGDSDLTALIKTSTFDASVLEFDFVPRTNVITFQYVFGSDEYNEYVGSQYNDIFVFFVNGVNRALIPGTDIPVAINNINNDSNSTYYFDNSGASINTELDGRTVTMTVLAPVTPNISNHIKIAIADAYDSKVDSDVFIKEGSFGAVNPTLMPIDQTSDAGQPNALSTSIVDGSGTPLSGITMKFKVESGPNAGILSPDIITNGNGEATWSYTGSASGTDVIVAYIPSNNIYSNRVYQHWVVPDDLLPIAHDDEFFTLENSSRTGNVKADNGHGADFEGNTPSIVSPGLTNVQHGTLILDPSGGFTYHPNIDYSSLDPDIFTYILTDSDGDQATGTVYIYISAINHNPIAVSDSTTTIGDTTVIIDVLTNDSDPDGNTLTITNVTNGSHGIVVNNGTSVTYTANTDWSGPDSFTYTISDGKGGSATATVSVLVNPLRYTITATNSSGGTIVPYGPVVVDKGGSKTFTITPDEGYHVADVLVDDVSAGAVTTHTFTGVIEDHTIAASFAINQYTITASAGANGSIAPSGSVTVNYGTDRTFAIVPDTGYHVADVLVDGSPVEAATSYTFTNVTANHIIAATFAINQYTITASAGANGSITPSQTVNYGTASQPFTITPDPGYHVADVLVDGASVGAVINYQFTNVIADHTIVASFSNTYTINASAGTGGTIDPAGTVNVIQGASKTFTMHPDTDYRISDVVVNGSSVGILESYTFATVTADCTISVGFALLQHYTITATAGTNGSISPSGAVDVVENGTQSLTITPDTGYHIVDVLVDGLPKGAITDYTFTSVNENHTIAATFAIDTFSISAGVCVNGSIDPSGPVTVNYGTNQTFTIVPESGYHVVDVLVDGVSVGAMTSYEFTNITASHTITAIFAINQYTITASAGPNGSIDPSGATLVNYNTDQIFTITPNEGYHVADVLVDGVSVGGGTTYTLHNVTKNYTIEAVFAEDVPTFTITASAVANGSISPLGAVPVKYGENQSFSITPATGYHVADVKVDDVSQGAITTYTFQNVIVAHTISASFAINTYTIEASAGLNGSITPSGSVVVNYNSNVTFNVTANSGYNVLDIVVDGQSAGATSSYTFKNVTGTHTIVATFAQNQASWAATIDFDPNTLNLNSGGKYGSGCGDKWVTVYIEALNGWNVRNIDGSTVLLNGKVPAYMGKEGWAKPGANQSNMMDHDRDGKLERMVKFDRASVEAILSVGEQVKITITGKADGMDFEGYDIIRVINAGWPDRDNENHPPKAVDDSTATAKNTPVTIDVLTNDTDADRDTLSIKSVTTPIHGSAAVNGKKVTYTPNTNWSGTDIFSYTVSDGKGGFDIGKVTVTVSASGPGNQPKATILATKIISDTETALPDWSGKVEQITPVLIQDYLNRHPGSQIDNTWQFQWAPEVAANPGDNTGAASGAWTTFTGSVQVPASQSGTTRIWVREVWNNQFIPFSGATVNNPVSAEFYAHNDVLNYDNYEYIDVKAGQTYSIVAFNARRLGTPVNTPPVNTPPVAVADSATTKKSTPVTILVLANDTDADRDSLSVKSVTQPAHGQVIKKGSSVIYVPKLTWTGTDTFTYTISDGKGGSSAATVTVTVKKDDRDSKSGQGDDRDKGDNDYGPGQGGDKGNKK
ncbi:MAG: choice-of-anchor L domain-containing protein [Dehalococcoidia bacterium]